jgi:phosphoenolpyruvate synthase/pyruvate phosphate dikinase
MNDHPSLETLKRFATGTGSREENRAVIAHLIQGCTACSDTLRALMEPEPVVGVTYDAPLDQFAPGFLQDLERSISPLDPLEMLRTLPRGVLLAGAGGEGVRRRR